MARLSYTVLSAITTCACAALGLLAFDPAPVKAQRSPLADGEPCPSRMYGDRDELICHCDETVGGNPVWGTDTYTDDSALCHAALHAGAIKQAGGVIHVRRAPGLASYLGSTRNGIASRSYGSYESSIVFDSPQALARSLGGAPLCPVTYTALPAGWAGDCYCDPGRSGPAWGTNPYSVGSAVCTAAVHAGLIDGEAGGLIHVAPGPMVSSLPGSTRNGFTTVDYEYETPTRTFLLSRSSH